jgi:hypothetical protein
VGLPSVLVDAVHFHRLAVVRYTHMYGSRSQSNKERFRGVGLPSVLVDAVHFHRLAVVRYTHMYLLVYCFCFVFRYSFFN